MTTRLVALLFVVVPSAAQAQWWGGYDWGYHSSTAEEGIQRGYADVVRSWGMANLLNSQAMINQEQARKAYLENRSRATQTYFEMRRYNAEARQASRPAPLSMEQYVRLAREQAPPPLTATQLDPLTGAISWPTPLRLPEYEGFRKRIDKLFQDRAGGYLVFQDAQQAIEDFQEVLRANASRFDPKDLVTSRRFLDSLMLAARGVQS